MGGMLCGVHRTPARKVAGKVARAFIPIIVLEQEVLRKKVLFQNLSIPTSTDNHLCCRWFKKKKSAVNILCSCIRQSAHAESVVPLRVSFLVKILDNIIVSRGSVYRRAMNYDMLYLVCSDGQCCMMQACGIVYGVPSFCSASLIAFLKI